MLATPVSDSIHWVGAIDWNLRDFHGYATPRGTTYNAYIVQGAEKIALVDTVKTPFIPEMLERIADVVPLDKVDYIVVNHVEPDHNSGLRAAMDAMPQAKVVASAGGVRGIAGYHGDELAAKVTAVGADDVIDLGGKTLRFLPMPMVHWPDSMFTNVGESGTLLPNDAFGQHIATSERFADEIGLELAVDELKEYYANILQPLSAQVSKAVAKVIDQGWVCDVIAPSHGVIWRHDSVPTVIDAYDRFTAGETEAKLVVAYCTMWGSTDILAREIADGARAAGVDVHLFDFADSSLATITTELFDARALLLGSPTLHHQMHYRTAAYLQYIAGLKPAHKLAGVFGSFGWSSGATKQMAARLDEIGFELPEPDFTVKYKPNADGIAAAQAWGAAFGERVKSLGEGAR
jgi:anaerobic nitric oxide reductase flavorubredoxin